MLGQPVQEGFEQRAVAEEVEPVGLGGELGPVVEVRPRTGGGDQIEFVPLGVLAQEPEGVVRPGSEDAVVHGERGFPSEAAPAPTPK